VDEPAVDARLDLDAHATIPEKNGRLIEYDGAVVALADELVRRVLGPDTVTAPIQIAVIYAPPRLTAAALAKLDISTVVGAF
jgi:hypothetical protein